MVCEHLKPDFSDECFTNHTHGACHRYIVKKEKQAWTPGEELTKEGFWAAFNQGRNFNKNLAKEREETKEQRDKGWRGR